MTDSIAEAKAIWSISRLWDHFNLPGTPRKICRSPFREDRKASFSVYQTGGEELWHDFSDNESGDAVSFYGKALGITNNKQAVKEFLLFALGENSKRSTRRVVCSKPKNPSPKKRSKSTEHWRKPSDAELEAVIRARVRQSGGREAHLDGLRQMVGEGTLWITEAYGKKAYVLGHPEDFSADYRRLDGKPWWNGAKVVSPKGCDKDWPLGLHNAKDVEVIVWGEGSGDFMALHSLRYSEGRNIERPRYPKIGVISMLCPVRIPDDALMQLSSKTVWLYPHIDTRGQGENFAYLWKTQLERVGCSVTIYDLKGMKDKEGEQVNDVGKMLSKLTPHELKNRYDLELLLPN